MLGPVRIPTLLLLCACAVASPATAGPADALIGRLSQALQEIINQEEHLVYGDDTEKQEHPYISQVKADLDKRIINGDDAEKHEHPYIASLQRKQVRICKQHKKEMWKISRKCYNHTVLEWSKEDDCFKAKKKFLWYSERCLDARFFLNWKNETDCTIEDQSQLKIVNARLKAYVEKCIMADVIQKLCLHKEVLVQKENFMRCLKPPYFSPLYRRRPSQYIDPFKHVCGGTLIKDDVVLTAAHCIAPFLGPEDLKQQRVVLGEHHLEEVDEKETHRQISEIKVFPGYDQGLVENDIALIFLSQKVDLSNPTLKVAKLSDNDDSYENKDCLITGWGMDESGRSSSILQELQIKNIPLKECNSLLSKRRPEPIKSSNICVYNKPNSTHEDHTGACMGDSGGPMMCGENLDRLAGVTSFVYDKCTNLPSVYARVSSYKTWIDMWTSDDYLDLLWISEWDDECIMKMKNLRSGQPNPCPPPSLSDLRMLVGKHETD